jgi:hypothetical protein
MAEFYKIDSSKMIGGAGRLVYAKYGVAFPTKIEDVIDLSTYELKGPWKDLGATTEGIETTRGFEEEEFTVDQKLGAVDTDISAWSHGLSTNLAENSLENRQLALIGSPIVETPATLGTATTTTAAIAIGDTTVKVTTASGITAGSYIQVGGETVKVASVSGTNVYLERAVTKATASGGNVAPITALPTRRIGYGTPTEIPFITLALLVKRKDGTISLAVFRKAKVASGDKSQTFNSGKRILPFALTAFPVDGVSENENVYYEIEQVLI